MTLQPPSHGAIAPPDPTVAAALGENRQTFLAFLTRRLGSAEMAEDVLQQCSLRALSNATTLRRRESVVEWLYRLLSTTLVDNVRRDATRRRYETAYARQPILPQEDSALMTVVCICLHRLLPTLQPAYAEIIRRVDLAEESREQVAADLGLTVNNVTVRLHRARQALKRALLLSCTTCPEDGFLHCTCDPWQHTTGAAGQAQSHPP